MKSYAYIDRIVGGFAVCEVELVEIDKVEEIPYEDRETIMIDVEVQHIISDIGQEVQEKDIIVVEHDGVNVISTYCIDEEEKRRKIEYMNQI